MIQGPFYTRVAIVVDEQKRHISIGNDTTNTYFVSRTEDLLRLYYMFEEEEGKKGCISTFLPP